MLAQNKLNLHSSENIMACLRQSRTPLTRPKQLSAVGSPAESLATYFCSDLVLSIACRGEKKKKDKAEKEKEKKAEAKAKQGKPKPKAKGKAKDQRRRPTRRQKMTRSLTLLQFSIVLLLLWSRRMTLTTSRRSLDREKRKNELLDYKPPGFLGFVLLLGLESWCCRTFWLVGGSNLHSSCFVGCPVQMLKAGFCVH